MATRPTSSAICPLEPLTLVRWWAEHGARCLLEPTAGDWHGSAPCILHGHEHRACPLPSGRPPGHEAGHGPGGVSNDWSVCAAEFYGQLVTALTFGCVFPLCVIFKVVFFTTRCVENKSCSRQKGDITEPLLQRKTFVKKYICNFHPFFFCNH